MDDIKIWLPPLLTLLGTLIVVTFTAWINTRSVAAMVDGLRHDMRANLAEALAPVNLALQRLENKLDHMADVQASHSEAIAQLKARG